MPQASTKQEYQYEVPDLQAEPEAFPLDDLKRMSPILLGVLAAVVFFSLAWMGIWITREAGRIASIWLANAALLSMLLSTGRRNWPAMLAAALAANILANLSSGDGPVIAATLSLCNTFEIALSAYWLDRIRPNINLSRRTDLILFFAIAGLVAPAATAFLATSALVLLVGAPFLPVLGSWFAADSLGMLLLPPLLLGSYHQIGQLTFAQQLARPVTLLLLLVVCVVTVLVFGQNQYPLLFFLVPPLMLAAFYVGFAGAAASLLMVGAISIPLTIYGYGPVALIDGSLPIRIFFLQVFLATCIFITLLVAANLADRQRLLKTLQFHMNAAQQANRTKSEFLSTVSHELRTPLTSIRGSLGLISAGVAGELPPKAVNLVKIAHANSERLVRLINDILDMEKIELGKMTFDIRTLPVRAIVEQAIAANHNFMPEREVQILFDDDAPGADANVDPDRLNQVLSNLLSNAIKFSPAGEKVLVKLAWLDGHTIRISVADNGPGIPQAFRNRIFGKFEQADVSDTREKAGTGLGLSISRSIVEKLGGSIGFQTLEGKGTTFFVDLPGRDRNKAIPAARESSASDSDSDRRDRVLICEDGGDVATVIAGLLEAEGFASDVAPDVATAKAFLDARGYVALTLDIKLVGESGLSLFRHLRASPANSDLPVIVISALADMTKRKLSGSAVGIIDWLEKPVEPSRLHAAMVKIASRNLDRRPHVLHVEDDEGVLQVMFDGFGPDVSVMFARTCEQARDLVSRYSFDAVILDISLPDGSGLDLLSDLPSDTAVIIFSATDLDERLGAGVGAVMTKTRASELDVARLVKHFLLRTADARHFDGG